MSVKVTDRIVYPSRANAADALDALEAALGYIPAGVDVFLKALDYYATRKGIDNAVIASHAANECNLFRDDRFKVRKDAFGIGVTEAGVPGAKFDTYDDAAFYAVAEYCLKLYEPLSSEEIDRMRTINRAKFLRVADLVTRDDFPKVITISQMNTRFGDNDCWWMCDPNGPAAIVQKSKILFPNLPDQTDQPTDPGGEQPVTLQIDTRLTTRDLGFFTTDKLWITIHNNGNPSSDRFDEAAFVQGGGGSQGVLYHGAIDADGFCQIEKFDRKGVHAGNTTGNATSIGFEMCEGSEPWDQVKENTAQLLAAIVLGDPRLDFGVRSKDNFSLDRVKEHRDWPGANPNCPRRLIQTDGGVEKVVARAREIVKAASEQPPTDPKYTPPALPSWFNAVRLADYPTNQDFNGTTLLACKKRLVVKRATVQRATAGAKGKESGPALKAGTVVDIVGIFKSGSTKYVLAAGGGDIAPGARIKMADLSEVISITERAA